MKFRIVKPSEKEIEEESKKWRFHTEENKKCIICGSNFNYGFKKTKCCTLCKVIITCSLCGKEFEYIFATSGREYYNDLELKRKIINNDDNIKDIKLYCPECVKKYNPGLCSICKKENKYRDGANRGRDSYYQENSDYRKYDVDPEAIGCDCSHNFYLKHNSSEKMRKVSSENAIKYLVPITSTYKYGGLCNVCHKYNKLLDIAGRGTDEKEWISNEEIYSLIIPGKLIVSKGDTCGCSCSKKAYKIIGTKSAETKMIPGICAGCGRDTRKDDPPTGRTVACLCDKCQAKIAKRSHKVRKEKYDNGEIEYYCLFDNPIWRTFNLDIPCNDRCKFINNCDQKDCLKNIRGWCEKSINSNGALDPLWRIFNLKIPCSKFCNRIDKCLDTIKNNALKNKWGYCPIGIHGGIPNFIVENSVKTYKGIPVDYLAKQILNETLDINDFPGFNIRLGRVCYGTIDILTDETIYLQQNFQTMDGVRYYKNEPIEVVIAKLESGEYNTTEDCPGWNKRFGRWHYGTVDILAGDVHILNRNNFEIVDGVTYSLNKLTGEYVPWNIVTEKAFDRLQHVNPSEEERDFIKDEGFERFPIINNTDDPDMWNREQTDKALCEAGYGWIVYIKLFLGHPFIGGKTGTRAVSNSPIDFDFKVYDENDLLNPDYSGAGRTFIKQMFGLECKYTDHKYVLVKGGFKNEKEALEYEHYILNKYDYLFAN